MKMIPLTQGQIAIVDDEDFADLSRFKWCAHWDLKTKTFYATRSVTNPRGTKPKQSVQKMHRRILGLTDPLIKGDHKNHDTLDNRRANLRIATNAQNRTNLKGAQRNSKSGVRGVSWNKIIGRWRASIKVNNKTHNLGNFVRIEDASSAYAEANRKHFGDFGGTL